MVGDGQTGESKDRASQGNPAASQKGRPKDSRREKPGREKSTPPGKTPHEKNTF